MRTLPHPGPKSRVAKFGLLLVVASIYAKAQFKEVGPPPYTPAVARQHVKALLDNVNPANRKQTIDTITGWAIWYRDLIDEELIKGWKGDGKAALALVIEPLADSRVASETVAASWREQRPAAFTLSYASMLGHLMERYPESAEPFRSDLLGPAPPELSATEAEAVCRILVDMPDLGTWKKDASRILPRYKQAAEVILRQDLAGSDPDKSYQAKVWLDELRLGSRAMVQAPRANIPERPVNPRANVTMPPASSAPPRPTILLPTPPPAPAVALSAATSGTLVCSGIPIPQNAEYVFRNLPAGKMKLDYDMKNWDARIAPGDGQTQRVILKNKGSGPQKRCVVHWSAVP